MKPLSKLLYILTPELKTSLLVISVLTFVGMLFEMVGIGIFVPVFGILLNPDFVNKHEILVQLNFLLGNPTHEQLSVFVLLTLILFYIVKTAFLVILNIRQSKFIADLNTQIQNEMFEGYLNQSYLFHIQNNSSKLIRNLQTEVSQFLSLSLAFLSLALEFSVVLGISLLLVLANPLASVSVFLFMSLCVYFFQKYSKKYLQYWGKIRQEQGEQINKNIFEGLGGIKEIILTGKSFFFAEKLRKNVINVADITIKYLVLSSVPRLFLELITILGLTLFCLFILFQNMQMESFIPIIGVFAAAAFRLIPSVGKIMNSIQVIKFFQPVIDLLYKEFRLIREPSSKIEKELNLTFDKIVELKSINFKYPKNTKNSLSNIKMTIKKGQTIGIVGQSGGGKSTLINIITGLIKPDSGDILLDHNLIETNSENWRSKIGYVPQNIYLIDDTINNNIAFGIDKSKINNNAVNEAILGAQLQDLINSLPQGQDSIVGERGVNLSGGQIQRIGIARALYNNPEILIFDEATSALDTENEDAIMDTIKGFGGSKTIIIISHKTSPLSQCDRIYEMKNGELLERIKLKSRHH